ncbi:hypothetical protein THAOC_12359, partial [Thalassiosira oceanica]
MGSDEIRGVFPDTGIQLSGTDDDDHYSSFTLNEFNVPLTDSTWLKFKFALDASAQGTVQQQICLKLYSGNEELEHQPCLSLLGSNGVESEDNGQYTFQQENPEESYNLPLNEDNLGSHPSLYFDETLSVFGLEFRQTSDQSGTRARFYGFDVYNQNNSTITAKTRNSITVQIDFEDDAITGRLDEFYFRPEVSVQNEFGDYTEEVNANSTRPLAEGHHFVVGGLLFPGRRYETFFKGVTTCTCDCAHDGESECTSDISGMPLDVRVTQLKGLISLDWV